MTEVTAAELESADKRRYVRVRVPEGYHIACEGLEPKFRGLVRAVSPRGLFVQTVCAFSRGRRLHLCVRFDGEALDLEGVVRDIDAVGIGVEFLPLSNEQQESLARLTLKFSS